MHIERVHLKNFRCFEDVEMDFHPHFNVLVGINGTGKTSILEALRVSIGSLFLSLNKSENKIAVPGILGDDVRLAHLEQQYPVVISTTGVVGSFAPGGEVCPITWERSLNTSGGATRYVRAREMQEVSRRMQEAIRRGMADVDIPLVAYFSTDRFKKEKRHVDIEPDGSRLRGYYNALDSLTNIKFFLDLYYTETLWELQYGSRSKVLEAVNEAVMKCVRCERVLFDIKQQKLLITLSDTHETLPFHLLSDGVRSVLALAMEMAFRCYLLNPHLEERAATETKGVVLIDEIDLHLHPEWQKRVIGDLRSAFPCLQFIVTTHAPLVVGSLSDGKIFSIKDNRTYDFPLQTGKDANYILNEMGTAEMDETLKKRLETYFILIEKGLGRSDEAVALRNELANTLGGNHTDLQRAVLMLSFF